MTSLSSFSKTYVSLMDSGCSECHLTLANTSFSSWFCTCSNGVLVELDSAAISLLSLKWNTLFSLFAHHHLLLVIRIVFNPLWLPAFPGIVSKSLAVKALYPPVFALPDFQLYPIPSSVHCPLIPNCLD
ncbi:hypothetical protein Tco_1081950 [Tanacetum coccineum]|uniref:Uncharacterized protein n=1 Tax=Tanacetum coccineum TaxID=301880 RepID=A0ABQ5I0H4_9ASTR